MDFFFLYLHENIWHGYSIDWPQWGQSSEYPIYPKCWDTLSSYNTGLKIWNSPFYYCLMCLKYYCMYGKQYRPWFSGIWSGSTLFAKAYLSQFLGLSWYLQCKFSWGIQKTVNTIWPKSIHLLMCLKSAGTQCWPWSDIAFCDMIWVYTVCSGLSVPILRINIILIKRAPLIWFQWVHDMFARRNKKIIYLFSYLLI